MTDIATIDFHGDRLFAFERDGQQYVAMRPIVEALGLDWSGQYRRIERDPVLSEGVAMMATPSNGGVQETVCLPLHLLNGWLFGIDAARVKPELRERITLYRRECFQVLADHFGARVEGDNLPAFPQSHDQLSLQERRQLVNEARVTFDRQSARELWLMLGLPTTEAMRRCGRPPITAALVDRVRARISANPGVCWRDLHRSLSGAGDTSEIKEAVSQLERDGFVHSETVTPATGGHPTTRYSPAH